MRVRAGKRRGSTFEKSAALMSEIARSSQLLTIIAQTLGRLGLVAFCSSEGTSGALSQAGAPFLRLCQTAVALFVLTFRAKSIF